LPPDPITDKPRTLQDWLAWLETLHPREIELGLERTREVGERLTLVQPPFTIVTVAGTNGKGSTVAMLEHALHAAGYRVGAYTSPHLIDYNERVRVATQEVSDAQLINAFERVEAARHDTPLTYFEFGTLAALDLFRDQGIEIALLEVGLGGRLDAVNAWDADVAIVTSVGTDHQDWLGPDREVIGREKAGVFRAGRCAICGDTDPPRSLLQQAQVVDARLFCIGRDFHVDRMEHGWSWNFEKMRQAGLPRPAMRGNYQLNNAACMIMALKCLAGLFPVTVADIRAGLTQAVIRGRFQTLPGFPRVVLDVAHNREAAIALADTLRAQPCVGNTIAVCAMLRDKPHRDVARTLAPLISAWHVAPLVGSRAMSAKDMHDALVEAGVQVPVSMHASVEAAFAVAHAAASPDDRIVVFGSFHTVGDILRALSSRDGDHG